MDISEVVCLTIVAFGLLLFITLYLVNLKNTKTKIETYLLERGATEVQVHPEWFTGDRDTLTFTVHYTGVKGNKITARCKVRFFFMDNEIFWSDPLNLELAQVEKGTPRSQP